MDSDRDALERLLGHLVTAGVLTHAEPGAYGLTPMGEHLRDDDPDGVRPWLDLEGAIGRADLTTGTTRTPFRILHRCADAASDTGKVLVVEHVADLHELAESAGLKGRLGHRSGLRSLIELHSSADPARGRPTCQTRSISPLGGRYDDMSMSLN